MKITILKECGHEEAMLGLSLSYNADPDRMAARAGIREGSALKDSDKPSMASSCPASFSIVTFILSSIKTGYVAPGSLFRRHQNTVSTARLAE